MENRREKRGIKLDEDGTPIGTQPPKQTEAPKTNPLAASQRRAKYEPWPPPLRLCGRSRLPQLLPRARTLLPRSPASSMAELQPQPCPQAQAVLRIWAPSGEPNAGKCCLATSASAASAASLEQTRSITSRPAQRRKRRPHQPPRGPQGMPSTQELERGRESLKREAESFGFGSGKATRNAAPFRTVATKS